MTERIKTDLAARMNQYVNYRRRSEDGGKSFVEALNSKAGVRERASASARSRGSAHASAGGRAHTARASVSGPMKHITEAQAMRLAKYAPVIQQASQKFNVPVELVCGVILQESGGNFKAVSHCGATGLMQLMPGTAKRLGVSNSFDPVQNIMGGTKYLRMLLDEFGGNVSLAVAGYNSGEGNVKKYGNRIPPFKETQAYVPNVLKYADTMWHLLKTPVKRIEAGPSTLQHRTIYTVSKRA